MVFVDDAGVTRTLDIVSAPFGLDSTAVHDTAVPVALPADTCMAVGVHFYVMHPVLGMESRVHNVAGLPGLYDTELGRKQLRLSILCAVELLRDVLEGRIDAEDPPHTVLKLNERIFRFCMQDPHARELYRRKGVDPGEAIVDHVRLPAAFHENRLPQLREQLATRTRSGPSNG